MPDLTLKEAADFIDEELKFVGDMLEPEAEQAYSVAVNYLRKIASGELAEVKHGHWEYGTGAWLHCSKCGGSALASGDEEPEESPYCPYCDALMDGKDDSNAD